MDIKPHPRRPRPPIKTPQPPAAPQPVPEPQLPPLETELTGLKIKKKSVKKIILLIVLALLTVFLGLFVAAWLWYQAQLAPVDPESQELVPVTIELGTTPDQIGQLLEENGVIRNKTAFDIHTRIAGIRNNLQAGTYRLSPADSTPEIAQHLTNGKVDEFTLTFHSGVTLRDYSGNSNGRDVTSVLKSAGFSEEEITSALSKKYEHPLLKDRPEGVDLEGYVYGQTYQFASGSDVETILLRTFDEFWAVIENNNLIERYADRGMTLYEGITLASIIEKERYKDDEKQIAQVFYSRLALDMPLGSDPTYQYIADKMGVPRDLNLDSPYNTRRYGGLPPGPIAVPSEKALMAVAEPAEGDFLYFLSGDDDVTYFSRTLEEHEANIRDHCQVKCSTL